MESCYLVLTGNAVAAGRFVRAIVQVVFFLSNALPSFHTVTILSGYFYLGSDNFPNNFF